MKLKSILACAVMALAPTIAAAQQTPIKIQAVTQANNMMPQVTEVEQPILRDGLNAKSDGKIELSLFSWVEKNINGSEVLRLVRSGQVEIGAAPTANFAGDVPILNLMDLSGLNPSVEMAAKVSEALVPVANETLEKYGVRIVATFPIAAQVFFCKGDIKTLADLKGKRVRTGGGSINDFLSYVEAQPVAIGFPEVYTALEHGVTECAITGTSAGNSARWYEVTDSLFAVPLAWGTGIYIVNAAWWDGLDPELRDMLTETFAEVQEAQWALGLRTTEDGIACNGGDAANCKLGTVVTKKPLIINRPSDADLQVLRESLSKAVVPAFVNKCGEECGEIYNRLIAPISGVTYDKS